MTSLKPDIGASALIVVDVQNDFVSEGGWFDRLAKKHPEAGVDMEFLRSSIPGIKKLVEAFGAGGQPVVYVKHVVRPDYVDARFPYWRKFPDMDKVETQFIVEGTWGAEIVDELNPAPGELVVVKKGLSGFHGTPLETILRNLGVTTCVMTGVTTTCCVSSTTRAGVEHNFHMMLVRDGMADMHREGHEAELGILSWLFGDVVTADQVIKMLKSLPSN